MNKDRDLTIGNPFILIFSFSLSLIVGNIFQQLYIVVDSIIVGNNIGSLGINAIGGTEWLIFLVNGFVSGLVQGFSVILGNKFGEKNEYAFNVYYKKARELCAFLSIILVIVLVSFSEPLLHLIGTKQEVFPYAKTYVVVIFFGLPFLVFYQLFVATLRSRGNSRTYLIAMTISSICNIALDILFISVLHMGIIGAALGTILSECFVMIMCGYQVSKTKKDVQIIDTTVCAYQTGKVVRELTVVGLPMALQSVITAIGGLIVINRINHFELDFLTGYAVANKIYGLLEIAASSYGLAIVAFVSQNLGAKKYERVRSGVRVSLLIGLVTAMLCSCIMFTGGTSIIRVFLKSQDITESILGYGHDYLCVIASFFPLLYFLYIFRASLQGIGNTFIPMVSSFAQLIMRVFCALVVTRYIGCSGIYYGEISAWIFADMILLVTYFYEIKKMFRDK